MKRNARLAALVATILTAALQIASMLSKKRK
jgi:hypothetical protein